VTGANPKEPSERSWLSPNIWASSDTHEGNPVRQLLVPSSSFSTVEGATGALTIGNNYGCWPAVTPNDGSAITALHARLPLGSTPGSPLSRAAWQGSTTRWTPQAVFDTFPDALSFSEASDDQPGLRTPQLGAVHAVLGYWTTGRTQPATVVMPTGTGKTETMLALLVTARPAKLLVLVPSDQLRDQVTGKFQRLGVLQEYGIVAATAARPIVGRVLHGFTATDTATAFAEQCNVIVSTPQALQASTPEALAAVLDTCSHLFVDEAHHVAAASWSAIRDAFESKRVVQFTATPFREDGQHLAGRVIYAFPLREAQKQGYFATIDYTAVIDFDNLDRAVAVQSVARLRQDIAQGYNHVLMARVSSIPRAHAVKPYYDAIASDLEPVIINSRMPKRGQREALKSLFDGKSRIVICVNMLGEGFDLPALKVAAVHDPQKSLGVTLQFIGRFARTSSSGMYGDASAFVARGELDIDRRLRALYAEDADWNLVLRDLTESAVAEQEAVSDFEQGFTSLPEGITLRSLLPKMSTVVYRTPSRDWEPDKLVDFFGEDALLTHPIGLNAAEGMAWCVVERRGAVRWGDVRTIEEIGYELYVLHFDSERRLLFINNSANSGVFEDLADVIVGEGAERFTGSTVYRVMADIQRLVPTTVGVVDAHNQFRRFSMHVGSDVTASFTQAEAGTKSQTNISGGGYRDGEHVSISASLKGRIWSHATATSLKHWRDWCHDIGTKLLDDIISIDQVIGQFLLPQPLTGRPESVLLGLEWPWAARVVALDYLRLNLNDSNPYPLTAADLVPYSEATTGPFRFQVKTESWAVNYEADVVNGRLRYRCTDPQELHVLTARTERRLSDWLNDSDHGLLFILDRDRIIDGDLLYEANHDRPPFDRSALVTMDWTGTNIRMESQRAERRPQSVQYRAIRELIADPTPWDIVLDDDGNGEIADVVCLRIDSEGLLVRLVHCKYAHGAAPGARLEDLYEVCGQAQKSIIWRKADMEPFFKTLFQRARRKQQRTGVSPFEVGDARALFALQEKARVMKRRVEIIIVQPGLSAAAANQGQLELLASTEAYLRSTINAPMTVWCSA